MKHLLVVSILGAAVLVRILAPASAAASTSCESLTALKLPDTTITSATTVPAGSYTPPPRTPGASAKVPTMMLPAHCSVRLVVKPAINVEIWLPTDGWNGRIANVGDQALAGYINYTDMMMPLKLGYAPRPALIQVIHW